MLQITDIKHAKYVETRVNSSQVGLTSSPTEQITQCVPYSTKPNTKPKGRPLQSGTNAHTRSCRGGGTHAATWRSSSPHQCMYGLIFFSKSQNSQAKWNWSKPPCRTNYIRLPPNSTGNPIEYQLRGRQDPKMIVQQIGTFYVVNQKSRDSHCPLVQHPRRWDHNEIDGLTSHKHGIRRQRKRFEYW